MAPAPSPSPLLQLLKLAQGVEGEWGEGGREGGGERERTHELKLSVLWLGFERYHAVQRCVLGKRRFTFKPRCSLVFEKFTGSEEPQEDLRFPAVSF